MRRLKISFYEDTVENRAHQWWRLKVLLGPFFSVPRTSARKSKVILFMWCVCGIALRNKRERERAEQPTHKALDSFPIHIQNDDHFSFFVSFRRGEKRRPKFISYIRKLSNCISLQFYVNAVALHTVVIVFECVRISNSQNNDTDSYYNTDYFFGRLKQQNLSLTIGLINLSFQQLIGHLIVLTS